MDCGVVTVLVPEGRWSIARGRQPLDRNRGERRHLSPVEAEAEALTAYRLGATTAPPVRHFLKAASAGGLPVDNSRRDVCNRGRDPLIGLDGASPHVHDPATYRQRFRRPLRSIR